MNEKLHRDNDKSINYRKSLKKRSVIIALQCLLIIVLVGVIVVQNLPNYQVLIEDIDDGSMAIVIERLDTLNINYKKENSSIYVDKDSIELENIIFKSILSVKGPDYSWTDVFADTSFTMTSDVREDQIMQAKIDALEEALENIEWIESVKLYMSIPDVPNGVVYDKSSHGSSSVAVMIEKRKDATISEEQIEQVKLFIKNSIQYLETDYISMIDENGEVLSATD